MKCELCNHEIRHTRSEVLCSDCVDMIDRLMVVYHKLSFRAQHLLAREEYVIIARARELATEYDRLLTINAKNSAAGTV